tara:strand:- start:1119 stop:1358 length:240 start_codon:yes stop_codon:yes gene_type:complete
MISPWNDLYKNNVCFFFTMMFVIIVSFLEESQEMLHSNDSYKESILPNRALYFIAQNGVQDFYFAKTAHTKTAHKEQES